LPPAFKHDPMLELSLLSNTIGSDALKHLCQFENKVKKLLSKKFHQHIQLLRVFFSNFSLKRNKNNLTDYLEK